MIAIAEHHDLSNFKRPSSRFFDAHTKQRLGLPVSFQQANGPNTEPKYLASCEKHTHKKGPPNFYVEPPGVKPAASFSKAAAAFLRPAGHL